MKKTAITIVVIAALIVVGFLLINSNGQPEGDLELTADQRAHIEEKRNLIRVDQPEPLAEVSSPLTISGEARGYWFFEASFSVRIVDANGNELGVHYAEATSDWMTEDFVSFTSELNFDDSRTDTGTLILERANPSGLAENADELRIPVRFGEAVADTEPEMQTVNLYYYNPQADTDDQGNIMCSEAGLVAVEREIPLTQTPLQDTVRLLLEGRVTAAEAAEGVTTEFPLDGLELEGVSRDGDAVTLGFSDPENMTSGGSCRAGILWLQISETALQFDGIEEVDFQPAELFQP